MWGVQGVYKQMVEAFRALGVEAVPGPGNIFDPEFHEAIMREENDDVPDGTVLKEFRRGFKLGNQLLRAAMVQVMSKIRGVTDCHRTVHSRVCFHHSSRSHLHRHALHGEHCAAILKPSSMLALIRLRARQRDWKG